MEEEEDQEAALVVVLEAPQEVVVGVEEDLEVGKVDQSLVGFPLIQQIIKLKQMGMEKLNREIPAL